MSLLEQQHKVMGNGMIERVVGVLQVFRCCIVGFTSSEEAAKCTKVIFPLVTVAAGQFICKGIFVQLFLFLLSFWPCPMSSSSFYFTTLFLSSFSLFAQRISCALNCFSVCHSRLLKRITEPSWLLLLWLKNGIITVDYQVVPPPPPPPPVLQPTGLISANLRGQGRRGQSISLPPLVLAHFSSSFGTNATFQTRTVFHTHTHWQKKRKPSPLVHLLYSFWMHIVLKRGGKEISPRLYQTDWSEIAERSE